MTFLEKKFHKFDEQSKSDSAKQLENLIISDDDEVESLAMPNGEANDHGIGHNIPEIPKITNLQGSYS